MSEKILSIIVPSYNMEKYLPKCLGSLVVAPELMERLEVLVVNDGSKDRTSEIAHEFAEKYPQAFRVIDKPNGHYGSCVNRGLSEAMGAYVKVLDADDYFYTESLANYLVELKKICAHDSAMPDLILTDYDSVDARSNIPSRRTYAYKPGVQLPMDGHLNSFVLVQMHAVTYRTELLRDIGYRQTEGIMYTDVEWTTYPLPYVKTFSYLPLNLYAYLVGREGQSMAPEVILKNGRMQVEIAARLCSAIHGEHIHDEHRTFYRQVLRRFAPAPYVICLRRARLADVDEGIKRLDSFAAQKSKPLFDFLDSVRLPQRNGFPYLRIWRKKRHLSVLQILLLRMYFVMASILSKILSLCCVVGSYASRDAKVPKG